MDPSKTKVFTISYMVIAFEKLLKTTHNNVTQNRYMYFLDSNKQLIKHILPLKVALNISKECTTERSSDNWEITFVTIYQDVQEIGIVLQGR